MSRIYHTSSTLPHWIKKKEASPAIVAPPFSSLDHQQTTKRFAKCTLAPTISYWNVLANQINPRVCPGGRDNNEPASNRRTLERDSHDISPCVNHPATAVSCRRQLAKTFGISNYLKGDVGKVGDQCGVGRLLLPSLTPVEGR